MSSLEDELAFLKERLARIEDDRANSQAVTNPSVDMSDLPDQMMEAIKDTTVTRLYYALKSNAPTEEETKKIVEGIVTLAVARIWRRLNGGK